LHSDSLFKNVERGVFAKTKDSVRQIDLLARELINGKWQPVAIECKISASLSRPRQQVLLEQLRTIQHAGYSTVLAIATDLPAEQVSSFTSHGIRVWTLSDLAERFGDRVPTDHPSMALAL